MLNYGDGIYTACGGNIRPCLLTFSLTWRLLLAFGIAPKSSTTAGGHHLIVISLPLAVFIPRCCTGFRRARHAAGGLPKKNFLRTYMTKSYAVSVSRRICMVPWSHY